LGGELSETGSRSFYIFWGDDTYTFWGGHRFSCSCPTVHIKSQHSQLHHLSCSCPTVHINSKQTHTTSPLLLFLSHCAYQILINTHNFTTSLVPVPQCISILNKHPQLHHFSCSCPTVHINYKQTLTTSPLLLFLSHSAYQILINTHNFTTSLVPVPQCISIINKHPQLHHFSCSCPTVHINHNKHPQLHHFSCSCPTVHINLNKHSQLHSICRSLLAVAQRTRRI
jgi:hypothetical protein